MKSGSAGFEAMPFLPVFLNLSGKKIVVAGGDSAAAAKAKVFAEAGADVRLYSVAPCSEALALAPVVKVLRRGWLFSDVADCALICAGAKLSEAMVEKLAGAASACGAQFYAVDRPGFSDFSSGAAITRGALCIGVSTAGAAPALGQAIRRELERLIPDSAADYIDAASAERAATGVKLKGMARRRFWAEAADEALALMQKGTAPDGVEAWRSWLRNRPDEGGVVQKARVVAILAPRSVDDLTLGQARALSRADVAFIGEDAPRACLSLLRREAERRPMPEKDFAADAFQALPAGAFAIAFAGSESWPGAEALAAL